MCVLIDSSNCKSITLCVQYFPNPCSIIFIRNNTFAILVCMNVTISMRHVTLVNIIKFRHACIVLHYSGNNVIITISLL